MLIKKIIFLPIFLLLVGCGVMNNPQEKVSRIFTADLEKDEITKEFIENSPYTGVGNAPYTLIDSNTSLDQFSNDLNSSAHSLMEPSQAEASVERWIKMLKDANIDFEKNNILFYTFKSAVCRYNDAISIEEKNVEIKITLQSNLCGASAALFVYAYRVSKEINQIAVKVEGMDDVNITNSSSIP
jgi:hypothetical protein